MAKYVLVQGCHVGTNEEGTRTVYKKGDVVELNAEQAKSFADKFKPAQVIAAEAQVAVAVAAAVQSTSVEEVPELHPVAAQVVAAKKEVSSVPVPAAAAVKTAVKK